MKRRLRQSGVFLALLVAVGLVFLQGFLAGINELSPGFAVLAGGAASFVAYLIGRDCQLLYAMPAATASMRQLLAYGFVLLMTGRCGIGPLLFGHIRFMEFAAAVVAVFFGFLVVREGVRLHPKRAHPANASV